MRPITMMMAQRKISAKTGVLLTWENSLGGYLSYQDGQNLKLFGKSIQSGTPTPSAPVDIQSVSGDLRVTGSTLTGGATLAISGRGMPLGATIPAAIQASPALMAGVWHDGTQYWRSDTDEPDVMVGGVRYRRKVQRVGVKVFNGTEFISRNNDHNYYTAQIFTSSSYRVVCTHFKSTDTYIAAGRDDRANTYVPDSRIYFQPALAYTTAAAFQAWLAAQYAAGTPVIVDYLLATPVETLSDPVPIPSVAGTTNIYSTSSVQPHIRASVLTPKGANT